MSDPSRPSAAIYGVSGTVLTAAERDFFARSNPLGFIVFKRNCETPAQVRTLVGAMREAVGRPDAPVLVDQEGGRVTRFKPPYWRPAPAAGRFARLARQDLAEATEATRLNARLIAAELADVGVTVNCLPVLDLALDGAHDVIGDRAFGGDPKTVATLGGAQADGLLDGGVLPVMKHIPGHGRSLVDSHENLPVVDADLATLEATDFAPFRALATLPWGMTCHVVYTAIDNQRPATLSPIVIDRIIRGHIGFKGLLLTDDIGMGALPGRLGDRTRASLAAGCEAVLHCTGDMAEMVEVAAAAPPLTEAALERIADGERRRRAPQPIDFSALAARVDQLLAAA